MKCDKCGEALAVFHFRTNMNGEVAERHLCLKCIGEDGFADAMFRSPPLPDMFGFGGMFNLSPYGRRQMPDFGEQGGMFGGGVVLEEAVPEESAARIPADAGSELKLKREISAMRAKMQDAVMAEDFESACVLRDKIRELEEV